MDRPRPLDLDKQHTKGLMELFIHDGRLYAEQRIDILDVLEIPVQIQLFQDLPHFVVINQRHIGDPLLLDSRANGVDDRLRNLRGLLRLKLRQNFFEMIQTYVGSIGDFVGRFFVIRLRIVDNMGNKRRAFVVITYHYSLFILGDEFAPMARFAHVGGHDEILEIDEFVVDIAPILLVYVLGKRGFRFRIGRGHFDFEKSI